jgi:hypothetical protein
MSLRSKVLAGVDKAFSAIGDLAQPATISNRDVTSYDFATGETVGTEDSFGVTVFLELANKSSDGAFKQSAIMKSGVDIDGYDTLTVGTNTYSITDFTDDSFIITMQLTREK